MRLKMLHTLYIFVKTFTLNFSELLHDVVLNITYLLYIRLTLPHLIQTIPNFNRKLYKNAILLSENSISIRWVNTTCRVSIEVNMSIITANLKSIC